MTDSISTSMTTSCRSFGCTETGIEKGKKCPKCGWERPDDDAVDAVELKSDDDTASDEDVVVIALAGQPGWFTVGPRTFA